MPPWLQLSVLTGMLRLSEVPAADRPVDLHSLCKIFNTLQMQKPKHLQGRARHQLPYPSQGQDLH